MFRWLRERRKRAILAEPFPEGWAALLQREVALYRTLSSEERSRSAARLLSCGRMLPGQHHPSEMDPLCGLHAGEVDAAPGASFSTLDLALDVGDNFGSGLFQCRPVGLR